jgi:DNA-binding winged helix-turn-helix (wHTH) protein
MDSNGSSSVSGTATAPSDLPGTRYRIGEWLVDPRSRALISAAGEVRLEAKSMALLVELIRAAPMALSKDELLQRVWPGVIVGEGALYRAIALLRKALDDPSRKPHYIESIPKSGYRFIAAVAEAEPAPDALAGRESGSLAGEPDRVNIAVRARFAEPDRPADAAAHSLGRFLGWLSPAFRVLRQREAPLPTVDYQLRVRIDTGHGVRLQWELLAGPDQELIWSGEHVEQSERFLTTEARIHELIATGASTEIRRHLVKRWDAASSTLAPGYWRQVLLGDHYRSMAPDLVARRERLLRDAVALRPEIAAARAALADFVSWTIANGLAPDPRAAKQEVIEQADLAVEIDSNEPYVLSRCGQALSRLGEHGPGLALCRRAFDLAPSATAKDVLANALCFAGQPEQAIELYRSIVDTMPAGHVFHYGKLAIALCQQGQLSEALDYASQAVVHFPRDYFPWVTQANLLAHLGRMDEAEAALARVRQIMPGMRLAAAAAGIRRTYARSPEQEHLLTGGLDRLEELQRCADAPENDDL